MYSRINSPDLCCLHTIINYYLIMKRLLNNNNFAALRAYSNKNSDAVLLADALGLLSPAKTTKSTVNYKPLIITNLHKGSVAERYNEIKKDFLAEFKLPEIDHTKQMDGLMQNLRAVSELPKTRVSQNNLYKHVKALQNEDELVELVTLSYLQNRLTLRLLTQFILNKNLVHLSRLPFDVHNLDRNSLMRNGWTNANISEFNVLLMKKYHDLDMPLDIIKMLKSNFELEWLPLIQKHQLLPFYERIIWKFYFDYLSLDEEYFISSLNNIRTSFLIWEASSTKSSQVARLIMKHHQLSALQLLFMRVCSSTGVENIAATELLLGKSPLLSSLKKISVKFKIYNVGAGNSDTVADRALTYLLIHGLERVVASHFGNWELDLELNALMHELKLLRLEMVHLGEVKMEANEYAVYTS